MHIVRPVDRAGRRESRELVANWLFVTGHLGMPALGVVGSAYATVASRLLLAVFCGVLIWRRERATAVGPARRAVHDRLVAHCAIVRLGAPAAGQILLEVGVFAARRRSPARIAPAAVAANKIVLNIIAFIFMIPYGIGSAAAVRVGHAIGRRDPERRAPRRLDGDPDDPRGDDDVGDVAGVGAGGAHPPVHRRSDGRRDRPRPVAGRAVFQLFDGLQAVTTGALRGLGDTQTPMSGTSSATGSSACRSPTGSVSAHGWGVQGLWIGLCAGHHRHRRVAAVAWHRGRSQAPDDDERSRMTFATEFA